MFLTFCYFRPILTEKITPMHYLPGTLQKGSFPLRISPVNVTKSAGNCEFDYIY